MSADERKAQLRKDLQQARLVLRVATGSYEHGEAGVDVVARAREGVALALARFKLSSSIDWRMAKVGATRDSEDAESAGVKIRAAKEMLCDLIPAHVRFKIRDRRRGESCITTIELDVVELVELLRGGHDESDIATTAAR